MDDISNEEGQAFAAFEIGDTVVHYNLPGVHDGVGVGGVVGGSSSAKINPTTTRCSFSGNNTSFVACSPLTRILLTSLKKQCSTFMTEQKLEGKNSEPAQALQDLRQLQLLPTG